MSKTVNPAAQAESDREFREQLNTRAAYQGQQEEKRAKLAEDAERVSRELHRNKQRRKATRAIIWRLIFCLVVWGGLTVAQICGLISVWLAVPLAAAVMVWAAFWAGAWVQFMYCKGGLLDG